MIGVCEAMVYAKKAGLDMETVLKSISVGGAASWSLSNLAPRMIKGDFEPGFYVKHFLKVTIQLLFCIKYMCAQKTYYPQIFCVFEGSMMILILCTLKRGDYTSFI